MNAPNRKKGASLGQGALTPAQTKELREELLRQLKNLLGRAKPGEPLQSSMDRDDILDTFDRAARFAEQKTEVDLRRQTERQIKVIQAALQRMETGGYGFCISCGEAIGLKRLSVNPISIRCVSCQRKIFEL
jgi:DnaK suppressor protein